MSDDPIEVLVPVALREVMDRLLPRFERETGITVTTRSMLNPHVPAYAAKHPGWAVALSNPWHLRELGSTLRPFARTPLALAADAPVPSVATERETIAALLRNAESIAAARDGTSGTNFNRLIDLLDSDAGDRTVRLAGGEPMRALLAGEVALAALPLTNIAAVAGAHVAAICPVDWNVHIDLSVIANETPPPEGHVLVEWLLSAERDAELSDLGGQRF